MAAEVVKHFIPKLVDLHNYIPANSAQQKLSNWNLLNRQDSHHLSYIYVFVCVCVCVCVFIMNMKFAAFIDKLVLNLQSC